MRAGKNLCADIKHDPKGGTMKKKAILFTAVLIMAAFFTVPASPGTTGSAKAVDYQKVRIKKFPIALQCWTFRKFSFFETLEKAKELGIKYLEPYPGQLLEKGGKDRFNHKLTEEQIKQVRNKLKDYGISLVSYGVVGFDNTKPSMREVFDFAKKLGIRTIVTEPKFDDFSLLEKMVKKYNINIAIHNHPLPSKYARPETVLEHIRGLDSRIGACADSGHWMRTGINPVKALQMLKGRIIDVHLKDLNKFGTKDAYDVPFGSGKANIHDILAELTEQNYLGFLAIEHEKKEDINNPIPPIRKGLSYIRGITYYQDYEEILSRSFWGYSKHGWNHYGPGYFELDQKTGILKGHGGMGLFWYSRKKFKDFILELDFKSEDKFTNSGVFLRVPGMVTSDDYIYHSFEIQVYDNGKGIHKTAAVYDAEAPDQDAFYPSGEWNHFKITFKGDKIKVELNDQLVLDWKAEPRGKVKDFAMEGYVGLQNHDSQSPIYFRNIFIKEL